MDSTYLTFQPPHDIALNQRVTSHPHGHSNNKSHVENSDTKQQRVTIENATCSAVWPNFELIPVKHVLGLMKNDVRVSFVKPSSQCNCQRHRQHHFFTKEVNRPA
eukprot:4599016-Amphidinium_carterae.1